MVFRKNYWNLQILLNLNWKRLITNNISTSLGVIAMVTFIIAYSPVYDLIIKIWISSDDYSHAFLTFPILFYMVWRKRHLLSSINFNLNLFGVFLIIFSSILYLFALLSNVYTIVSYSMFFSIISVVYFLFGAKGISILATELLLLLLIIPISDQFYVKLTSPLQLKVSEISETFITFIGIPLFREGNVMHTAQKSFEVVEACSGLRSIITLVTLSLLMGYFVLKRPVYKLALILLSIPTAVIVNIFRVTIMIMLFHYFGLDATQGWSHTILGLAIFIFGLLLLFSIQAVFARWEK
jgi:exosortase